MKFTSRAAKPTVTPGIVLWCRFLGFIMMLKDVETPRSRFLEQLFSSVDTPSVVFFRVALGLMMAFDQLHYIGERLNPSFVAPLVQFKYAGFEWVAMASDPVMLAIFWGRLVLGLCIAFGFLYRISTVLFLLAYVYGFLLDQASYNNHYYLLILITLAMIFVPAHRANSVDARIDPKLKKSTVPMWAIWLLRFHIALPYFFGGCAKINYDWLVRAEPMRLWLTTAGGIGDRYRFEIMSEPWMPYFFAWGGVLFDLLIVPLLLIRRTRLAAFIVATAFHLNNAFMFNIGYFPWLMIFLTTIFFEPDWPRRVGLIRSRKPAKKAAHKKSKKRRAEKQEEVSPRHQRLVIAVLATYVILQCLLPFRHFLYQGRTDWTEEGHRFAWRMKLRDKRGEVRFTILDPVTQQAQVVREHESVLTPRQLLMMTNDPEMIRQFAHFLAGKLAENGQKNIEIHAYTSISLNGYEPQPLINPNIDLLSLQRSVLKSAPWILPFKN